MKLFNSRNHEYIFFVAYKISFLIIIVFVTIFNFTIFFIMYNTTVSTQSVSFVKEKEKKMCLFTFNRYCRPNT